jgi:hypothetical protein
MNFLLRRSETEYKISAGFEQLGILYFFFLLFSLNLIPSPSVKIQIFGGKVNGGNSAKHCWVMSTIFCFQNFVDNAQQCFSFTPQANFPALNLIFF